MIDTDTQVKFETQQLSRSATMRTRNGDQMEAHQCMKENMNKLEWLREVNVLRKEQELSKEEEEKRNTMNRRNQIIVDQVRMQMDTLVMNSEMLNLYHNPNYNVDTLDGDAPDSFGSISSADERDCRVIMSGDHKYHFHAIKTVKEFTQEKINEQQEQIKEEDYQRNNSCLAKMKRRMCCRSKKDQPNDLEIQKEEGEGIAVKSK